VYSARNVTPDFNRRDPNRAEYSDYKIFGQDGHFQQWVHNSAGGILQRPKRVELTAGRYRIAAQANGYGVVSVPVVIVAGQDTVVHMEGSFNWARVPGFDPAEAVRLPGGEIVGWKAGTAMK
jgi:hypothetical protein